MTIEKHEFPEGVVEWQDPAAFIMFRQVRAATGCAMTPSPDPEAHVRHNDDGESEHSTRGRSRMSTAGDFFIRANQVSTFWVRAQAVSGLGGLGLYFDTQLDGEDRPLVHIDTRRGRLLWVCPSKKRRTNNKKREYIYYTPENPGPYLNALSEEFADSIRRK